MLTEPFHYTPSPELVERVRFFVIRTAWHKELMSRLTAEVQARLHELRFASHRFHEVEVAGSFEILYAAGAILRRYTWKAGFSQVVSVQGPTRIQSNLRLPPFFQGNFDSQLRSEFLLESPGPIAYFQPYEPLPDGELPVLLTLGCILKGETEHNRYLAHAVIGTLAHLNAQSGIPIVLGILTPDTLEQAYARTFHARHWVDAAFLSWAARLTIEKVEISPHPSDPHSSEPS
ncbi:MAG: hypothetical protein KatS3mg026_0388 [Bacteroidia bacterium]|nr:MAG: hypothetical protein KatS3mg026_0388 [Bacteroidia bacterium]